MKRFQHLGHGLHGGFESGHAVGLVHLQADVHEADHVVAGLLPVQQRHVAIDVAVLLQPLDARVGGGGRQSNAAGQFDAAQPAILLQFFQYLAIQVVQSGVVRGFYHAVLLSSTDLRQDSLSFGNMQGNA